MWGLVLVVGWLCALSHGLPGIETNTAIAPRSIDDHAAVQIGSAAPPPAKRLMVAVVSSPTHFRAREAIRNTWAMDAAAKGVDVFFFIGRVPKSTPDVDGVNKQINSETGVVRLHNFDESYHNLPYKAIGIFTYGEKHGYAGVMKVDDDTYLHVDALLQVLQAQDWSDLWAGSFVRNSAVINDPSSKWYAADQYPHENWPTYPNGPAFFLGTKAIKYIAANGDKLNKIRVDDAAVGVWLEGLNLRDVTLDCNFYTYHLKGGTVFDNPVSHEEMQSLHNNNSKVTLQACTTPPTNCLCWDNPTVSEEEKKSCWYNFGSLQYQDFVPRAAAF